MAYSLKDLCSSVVPAGIYKAQITDIKFKLDGNGQATKNIAVTYSIVEGKHAKKTIQDTIFEGSYSFRLEPFLKACKIDINREFKTPEEMFRFVLSGAKDKVLMVEVIIKPYQGKDYNNIKDWSPLPDSVTSSEEILQGFGAEPVVKGNDDLLDGIDTEIHSPTDVAQPSEEPTVDINMNTDEDAPF